MKITCSTLLVFVMLVLSDSCLANKIRHEECEKLERQSKLAGKNVTGLEKVLLHYQDVPEKLQAARFLINNMDSHTSQSYYWVNEKMERIPL
jgi:hypothetical protein